MTAPVKALSNQRYRDLVKLGYEVGIETGDIKKLPQNCEIICCTQEIYTNKYINNENATLIIDEFHYIYENKDRTRTYIDALKDSKAKNIFLCSATFGDIQKTKKYIENLTSRKFYIYENTKRLTEIRYEGAINKESIENALLIAFSRTTLREIAGKIVGTRMKREKIDKDYKEKNQQNFQKIKDRALKNNLKISKIENINYFRYGIAIYIASLLPSEKFFIEELFEEKLIDTVVGTDSLALGINFPVQMVVFTELQKYDGPISKNLFEQIAGRAGRKGYFDIGKVYYCEDFNNKYGYNVGSLYNNFTNENQEDIEIILTPIISKILKKQVTIEEEANYIVKYSTVKLDINSIISNITNQVDYINNYNILQQEKNKLYDYYWNDYEMTEEQYNDLEKSLDENKIYYEDLNKELMENIGDVYFDEYSASKNCEVFVEILKGKSLDEIVDYFIGTNDIYKLLQFRRYLKHLPEKYIRRFNILELEKKINEIDDSVLRI